MCDFLFVGLHRRDLRPATEALSPGRVLIPSKHPALLAALPPEYLGFWLTNRMCSCGFWPHCAGGLGPEAFADRNWSPAKVERAVNDLRASILAKALGKDARDTLSWFALVPRLSGHSLFAHVGWYSGDIDRHPVTVHVRVITQPDLRTDLKTGALNEIRPPVA